MPDPAGLLAVARDLLVAPAGAAGPSEARLRRAVSTAYYAVFHALLGAAAGRFVGGEPRRAGAWTLLYRGYSHRSMRSVCDALAKPNLAAKVKDHLGREAVSQDVRDFAEGFSALQELRHMADYDPSRVFVASDAAGVVDIADQALAAFERVPPAERTDVLALLLVSAPRGRGDG